jgi:glycosyltransferase involved in cell wall biosynthesis
MLEAPEGTPPGSPLARTERERRQFQRLPPDFRVDVVLPVFNEERCLRQSVSTVHRFLSTSAGYRWRVLIADNGSTDRTPEVAQDLAAQLPDVTHLRMPFKGRGRALRQIILESPADVVAYMDVDLSTDLVYFPLLIEGIRAGYDLSIGSRLLQAAAVERSLKREIISRGYNLLVRALFFNHFSDAQHGFKAIRTSVGRALVPLVQNNNWFFDTELLLLAERNGFRIFEVPVVWIEDPDSSVRIVKTIGEDLLGLARVRLSIHRKRLPREVVP